MLLVRARFQGDIERIFPGVKVAKTPSADYAFRVEVTRERVAQALTQEAMDMDYDNLKGAVDETFRHDVMMEVWAKMLHAQNSQLDAAAG